MKTIALNKLVNAKLITPVFVIATAIFMLTGNKADAQRIPWNSPQVAKSLPNPLSSDKTALIEGKTLYKANCAPCHGDKGTGNGPAAAALNPKPADHSSAVVQSETDGSLFWKLSEGRNPMPAYKKILTDKQRWELIDYIRTLAKAGK